MFEIKKKNPRSKSSNLSKANTSVTTEFAIIMNPLIKLGVTLLTISLNFGNNISNAGINFYPISSLKDLSSAPTALD